MQSPQIQSMVDPVGFDPLRPLGDSLLRFKIYRIGVDGFLNLFLAPIKQASKLVLHESHTRAGRRLGFFQKWITSPSLFPATFCESGFALQTS